jgi:hypothetical protein
MKKPPTGGFFLPANPAQAAIQVIHCWAVAKTIRVSR